MKRENFFLILILILAAFLRFSQLAKIPSGFIPEEVSNGWNAYSLLKTGKDEWGVSLPIVFRETGGYKLPITSYLIIPSISLFGLNEFAIRFPTAIAGIVAVYLTYLVAKKLFNNKSIAAIAAFLLAVSPWHMSVSRYGMDVNWGIVFFLSGLLFFIKSKDRPFWLIAASFLWGLTYYTYIGYIGFVIIFIIALLIFYRYTFPKTKIRKYIIGFILIQAISLLPYVFNEYLLVRYHQTESVGEIGIINRINEHRGACLTVYPQFVCRVLYNKPLENFTEIVKNLVNHYSTRVFFLYGSQNGLSGMPDLWGYLYLFEFPLLVIGTAVMIKRKLFQPLLIFWVVLYGIPNSLVAGEHIWRMMTILPLPQIIESFGVISLYYFLKNNKFRFFGLTIGIFIISFSILRFNTDYFAYFPYTQGSYSYFGFRDLYKYLSKIEKSYDTVIIAPIGLGFNQLYIYYVFYNAYNPRSYQQGIDIDRRVGDQNWVWVNRIGKWYFVSELGKVSLRLSDKTLLVVDEEGYRRFVIEKKGYAWIKFNTSLSPSLLNTIYYQNGNKAFEIYKLQKAKELYIADDKNIY